MEGCSDHGSPRVKKPLTASAKLLVRWIFKIRHIPGGASDASPLRTSRRVLVGLRDKGDHFVFPWGKYLFCRHSIDEDQFMETWPYRDEWKSFIGEQRNLIAEMMLTEDVPQ